MGAFTFAFALALHVHQKTPLVRHFIFFLAALLIVMSCAVVLYLYQAFSPDSGVFFALSFLSRILAVCLAVSGALLVNIVLNIFQSRRAVAIVYCLGGVFAVLVAVTEVASIHGGAGYPAVDTVINFVDLLLRLSILYWIGASAILSGRIENPVVSRMMRTFFIMMACFFPFLLLDEFDITLTLHSGKLTALQIQIISFPLLYIIFNSALMYYGFMYYVREKAASPAAVTREFLTSFKISERECEVMHLLFEGCSNREISERLFISPATVRNHLHNIFEKTRAKNRVDLVRLAGKTGF
jgi:DNA-binding CsgD family transcriptional regulator